MSGDAPSAAAASSGLQRHFGLLHATALNVTMIVGAGVFVTIPQMLAKLPGPYALLGWLAAGLLMLVDGLVWSELAAAFPGSGGSYLYLLECYGRQRWGRLMAFLFIWQFLISGPMEIATALSAAAQFANYLHPDFQKWNRAYTTTLMLRLDGQPLLSFQQPQSGPGKPGESVPPSPDRPEGAFGPSLTRRFELLSISPARLGALILGLGLLALLYRRITSLGKWTITFWLGVLGAMAWVLLEGARHFDPQVAFDFSGPAARHPATVLLGLGAAMIPAMYSYLGYYNVCYIGDEVRDPGHTIPRSIFASALLVCFLFALLHLAMLGTVPWQGVPTQSPEKDTYSLAGAFMRRVHGDWAAALITLLLIWSCLGSAFAGLLGYSRIPYGAARYGHFFSVFGRTHPVHRIPHVALLLVGGLTLFWSLFDLEKVITALIAARILAQFIGQVGGVVLLRRYQPGRLGPYKMWLYPLPCGLAVAGWLYVYLSADWEFIAFSLLTLALGVMAFLLWSLGSGAWPFQPRRQVKSAEQALPT